MLFLFWLAKSGSLKYSISSILDVLNNNYWHFVHHFYYFALHRHKLQPDWLDNDLEKYSQGHSNETLELMMDRHQAACGHTFYFLLSYPWSMMPEEVKQPNVTQIFLVLHKLLS